MFTLPSWAGLAFKLAPWAIALLCLVFGLWERGNALSADSAFEKFKADAAAAVAAQKIADAAESQKLLDEQAKRLAELRGQVSQLLQKIHHAPITNSCGPTVRDAARGVRDILAHPGSPNS